MRTSDIALLIDEPACANNANKAKGGCTRPKPGATAGGCPFDGAQITLFPITDVAHIVHGPIACTGDSWDNRGRITSYNVCYTKLLRAGEYVSIACLIAWKSFFSLRPITMSCSDRSVVIPKRWNAGPDDRVPRLSHESPVQAIGPWTM